MKEEKLEDWYCPECAEFVKPTIFETCFNCEFWGIYKAYFDKKSEEYIRATDGW